MENGRLEDLDEENASGGGQKGGRGDGNDDDDERVMDVDVERKKGNLEKRKRRIGEGGDASGARDGAAGDSWQEEGEVYKDDMFFRLDGLGYRVGQGLSER